MNAEEVLDHLISQILSEEKPFVPSDEETASMLAAARRLILLQAREVPPPFACQVECALRARIRRLGQQ